MYNKEFKEIYKVISKIYEKRGCNKIADNIDKKVRHLEDLIYCNERLNLICNRWDLSINELKNLHIKLINKTNYGENECLDIIEDYLNNNGTFYDIIRFYGLEEADD